MLMSFLGYTVVKNPPANAGATRDAVSIPGSGRSPGERNGYPLQYFCLENPMANGDRQAIIHGGHEVSDMCVSEQLTHAHREVLCANK